jgi:hypothetical protein
MKAQGVVVVTILAAMFMATFVPASFAAPWKGRGSGGWGMEGGYQRMYNPATVEAVTGEVLAVERITPMKGMGAGAHLLLKSDKETISVHLGPSWFIERLDTKLEKGDKVEVKGSRVTVAGKPAIIAAEVKKGDALLKLRQRRSRLGRMATAIGSSCKLNSRSWQGKIRTRERRV